MLEPTVSLSGGEALVKQGVEGLRWYEQIMGRRPRHAWMIDVCGWHEQMAQICSGLGLEAFVYCRYNPTGTAASGSRLHSPTGMKSRTATAIHWIASPDGSRALGVSPGLYCDVEFQPLFRSEQSIDCRAAASVGGYSGGQCGPVPGWLAPTDLWRRVGLFSPFYSIPAIRLGVDRRLESPRTIATAAHRDIG